ncbi:hypothetical protein C8A00DRAFT_39763 [Chaetomidium leptoderma]|uniref:C2H2-type domain-containing protein n=1 Tax=Chaetomidium leptoderma TaxID=669021 RepID=A0AAN6ZZM9_9PEZI|nr:hypothetical protein C8A00DRAFT_39763 [Chaetomidium leptoderma]
MEKAHNWNYIRSKSKGKPSPDHRKADGSDYSPHGCGIPLEADHNTSPTSASPQSLMVPQSDVDFILFDDDQADAIGDEDDHLYPGYDHAQNGETYLPWTSPTTRLRKNELLIERFSQTYSGAQEETSTVALAGGAGLDPVLSNFTLHGIQPYPPVDHHRQFVGDVSIKVESPVMAADAVFPRKRRYEPAEVPLANPGGHAGLSTSGTGPHQSRRAGAGQGAPTPSKPRGASKHGDSGGDDGCRPKKKSKPNPAEDFTDTSMPDIFRFAHPHIYDRDQTDKYSPCHTVHRDISTLVRHLSRPAHRLDVTDRTISSFDVEDADFMHPRVGVCRNCWQTFDSRPSFDAHVSRPCQKVSKGKREKWRVLYDSFTPLLRPTPSDPAAIDSTQQTQTEEAQWESLPNHLDGLPDVHDISDEAGTPPTSVPSPVMPEFADSAALESRDGQFVSANEHHKLQKEHHALRERHQQLERMTQVLLVQQIIRENMKHTATAQPDVKPPALGSSDNGHAVASPAASDQDSLVQHMTSQSTDVDVYRFMDEMEDTRQTLSRMNSGLSTTSRSTIHRVPPSPPSRPAELPDSQRGDPANHHAKHALAHRPQLPSIPDSGYGTEQRRGSLGDVPLLLPLPMTTGPAGFGPTPPSTAETAAADADKKMGESLPFEDSSAQRTPRANEPSPQHSQSGFLNAQEMADYDDEAYRLFYQDSNISPFRSLGFDFGSPSQVE